MKGLITILLEEFVHHFTKVKNTAPSHANELLDYLQKCYLAEEVSIVDYKNIFFELTKLNAEKPSDFYIQAKRYPFELVVPS